MPNSAKTPKWRKHWDLCFDFEPADRTSREVAVQELLTTLVTGERTSWFIEYKPTLEGTTFLRLLANELFGLKIEDVEWFVSEYELVVPPEWRNDIPFTYRCPDLAWKSDDQIYIVELKTEAGSYSARQMPDYLRLARFKHADEFTNLGYLGPKLPNANPVFDERQRYAELTWAAVPTLLEKAFPDNPLSEKLCDFLRLDLASSATAAATDEAGTPATSRLDPHEWSVEDFESSAVMHAIRLAPAVALAKKSDKTERGINVVFKTDAEAKHAAKQVNVALDNAGYGERVSVWMWRPESLGFPTTDAGRATGRELRLAPKFK